MGSLVLKLGTYYPCPPDADTGIVYTRVTNTVTRPVDKGVVDTGVIFDTRVHCPWTWPMDTGSVYQAEVLLTTNPGQCSSDQKSVIKSRLFFGHNVQF